MPKLNRRKACIKPKIIEKKEESNTAINKLDNKWHWEIITSFGHSVCFVCDKRIKNNGIYVGKHAINGQHIYRHAKCCSGSENWEKKFHGYIGKHTRKLNVID